MSHPRAEAERPGFGTLARARDTHRPSLKTSSLPSDARATPRIAREARRRSPYTRSEWPKPKCSEGSSSRLPRCPAPERGVSLACSPPWSRSPPGSEPRPKTQPQWPQCRKPGSAWRETVFHEADRLFWKLRVLQAVAHDQAVHEGKKAKGTVSSAFFRWARLDSNQGPTDYESAALTS